MKAAFFVASLFTIVASNSFADSLPNGLAKSQGLQSICANGIQALPAHPGWWHVDRPQFAVTADGVFATLRLADQGNGEFALVEVDQTKPESYVEVARFKSPIHDIAAHDGKIWLLFKDHFLAIDPVSGAQSAPVQSSAQPMVSEDSAAQAFAWVGEQLIIAHGSYGMTAFENGNRLAHTATLNLAQDGKLSKAIDVKALNTGEVVFAVEALTLEENPPFTFNGLLTSDLAGSSVRQYPYDAKTSGSLSQARLMVDGDSIYINNWGILQRASASAMKQSGKATITWVPTRYTENGVAKDAELLGDLLLDQGHVIACADVPHQDQQHNKVTHEGLLFEVQ